MSFDEVAVNMTSEIYLSLQEAVELGRWSDGSRLSEEQRSLALQAVMLWQSRHNQNAEHMSINDRGEMEIKSKQELKRLFKERIL